MSGKKKKKKLRVAFRRNRHKRIRKGDLTRELDEQAAEDLALHERVSGKGALTRRRTVVGVETEDDGILREVDESQCLAGRILSAQGLSSLVQAEDGTLYECAVRRVLIKLAVDSRKPVVAGDRVLFRPSGHDAERDRQLGVIERVEPRHSALSRTSHGREHVIVANVDQVLVVASADQPPLKPNFIDRMLVSTEKGGVRASVCINKCDLVDPAELQPIAGAYARLGYDVVLTSAVSAYGIERLRTLLAGRETVMAGQSGVGKSSLLNAVQPGLDLPVGEVAETGKGRHTTRSARLWPLDGGGWVADTPGVRQFELWDVIPEEVEGFFIEFRPFVPLCKFPDCAHIHEEGCGVKRAVDAGLISARRYHSYRRILSDYVEAAKTRAAASDG